MTVALISRDSLSVRYSTNCNRLTSQTGAYYIAQHSLKNVDVFTQERLYIGALVKCMKR